MPDSPDIPDITNPARYIPPFGLTFGGRNHDATFVDADHPLPVAQAMAASGSTPLAGSASASAMVGPFTPALGRAVWLTLSGSWTGSVTVKRSTDSGATKRPLTVAGTAWAQFTANANEPVAEETVDGAQYYLDITLTGGTVTYEVNQ